MKSLATAIGVGGVASLVTGRILDIVILAGVATYAYFSDHKEKV